MQHLQIIGEAARAISEPLKARHQEIPWVNIIGMRNILVHHYFDIDLPMVWKVVTEEVPKLKASVVAMLMELGEA